RRSTVFPYTTLFRSHVDEQLVHGGVAHAFADAERAAVYAIGDRRRRERVDRPEAPIVVPVVVQLHRAPLDHVTAEERQQIADPRSEEHTSELQSPCN